MTVLRNMYGPKIPDATDVLIPDLVENPLFYGSYSDFTFGMEKADMDAFRWDVCTSQGKPVLSFTLDTSMVLI